jgi:hypothetical protein
VNNNVGNVAPSTFVPDTPLQEKKRDLQAQIKEHKFEKKVLIDCSSDIKSYEHGFYDWQAMIKKNLTAA